MTRLAFLIGFAIGAWWVLRERREPGRLTRREWRRLQAEFGRRRQSESQLPEPDWNATDPYPSSLLPNFGQQPAAKGQKLPRELQDRWTELEKPNG